MASKDTLKGKTYLEFYRNVWFVPHRKHHYYAVNSVCDVLENYYNYYVSGHYPLFLNKNKTVF
jgi:hypothetical protein